jgi:hypothetical protein
MILILVEQCGHHCSGQVLEVRKMIKKSNFNTWIVVTAKGGHAELFFMSAIAIPQLEGKISAIVKQHLFNEMLLRNCNRAISLF